MVSVKNPSHLYEVEHRERYAERAGFWITELRISPAQFVPWHSHDKVADTFYVLEGKIEVNVKDPEETVVLEQYETYTVPAGRPHHVLNPTARAVTFLVLQGGGEYNYRA